MGSPPVSVTTPPASAVVKLMFVAAELTTVGGAAPASKARKTRPGARRRRRCAAHWGGRGKSIGKLGFLLVGPGVRNLSRDRNGNKFYGVPRKELGTRRRPVGKDTAATTVRFYFPLMVVIRTEIAV